jgi:hypothetical protein
LKVPFGFYQERRHRRHKAPRQFAGSRIHQDTPLTDAQAPEMNAWVVSATPMGRGNRKKSLRVPCSSQAMSRAS